MKLGALHHLAIKAWDVEALAKFYQDVLELEFERDFEDAYGLRSVWLRFGNSRLMIERSEEGGVTNRFFESDPTGLHMFVFAIQAEDRQQWREKLEGKDCHAVAETEHTLYFQDPESNRFGLSSWPV